jgi:hypothetical protein
MLTGRHIGRLGGGALAALLAGILLLPAAASGQANSAAQAHTATTEPRKAERIKTVPISKKAWAAPRSVVSLPPERIGRLAPGDRLEGAGEVQISVCLKPNPRHPGSGRPCAGKKYGYNPTLRARLALGPAADSAAAGRTMALGNPVAMSCTQKQPARNHHCVVSVPWSGIRIPDASRLPCAVDRCRLNLIVSAHHSKAKSKHRVVVGAMNSSGRIKQGRAKLSSARHRPGSAKPLTVWQTNRRATSKVPVVAKGRDPKRTVILSQRVSNLKTGDQLLVDARAMLGIGHLPYNALTRTEVILARKARSTRMNGKVADNSPRISAVNGFNCTLRSSGHPTPCDIRKTGVLSVKKNSKGPWFINVVAGQSAIGSAPMYNRWRPSHRAKVPKKGGWLRVERYRGSSSCSSCSTGGWASFSRSRQPRSKKPQLLVQRLARFGITEGRYQCKRRKGLICSWQAEGQFGNSPKYTCQMKAWWLKKGNRWKLKVCKSALGAQLWGQLQVVNSVQPTYAGACQELKNGNFRCKWFAEGFWSNGVEYWCKGEGTYLTDRHTWTIDPCRNLKG